MTNASPGALSTVGLNGKNAISAVSACCEDRQRRVGGDVDALDGGDDALLHELVGAVDRRLRRDVDVAGLDLERVAVDAAQALVDVADALLEALADLRAARSRRPRGCGIRRRPARGCRRPDPRSPWVRPSCLPSVVSPDVSAVAVSAVDPLVASGVVAPAVLPDVVSSVEPASSSSPQAASARAAAATNAITVRDLNIGGSPFGYRGGRSKPGTRACFPAGVGTGLMIDTDVARVAMCEHLPPECRVRPTPTTPRTLRAPDL